MGGLKNFITLFPHYFTTYSSQRFLTNCATNYLWLPLLLLANILLYIATKQWQKLILLCTFFVAYMLLVNVCFPAYTTPAFYVEALYTPLSFFLALPFIFDVLPAIQNKRFAEYILFAILLTGCIRIYYTHNTYTSRLSYERRIIDKYDGQKVIVKASKADIDTLQLLWSNPYEFLLLSACERGKPASILIDENPERLGWARDKRKELIVNSDIVPYTHLPRRYFPFTDTVNGYNIILSEK